MKPSSHSKASPGYYETVPRHDLKQLAAMLMRENPYRAGEGQITDISKEILGTYKGTGLLKASLRRL